MNNSLKQHSLKVHIVRHGGKYRRNFTGSAEPVAPVGKILVAWA